MQNTMLDSVVSSNSQALSDASASSAIKLFENPLFKARVIMRLGDPWFVAKDVATSIEHSDVSAMCKLCRDKDKVVVNYADLKHSDDLSECFSGKQSPNLTLISESGLYRILAKCNLPKCEPFESWVFDEVLPSIRKTGGYSVAQPTIFDYARALIAEKERSDALEAQNKALEAQRDEAIRTKAQIGSNREATAMATASAKSRECEKLREQIGNSEKYKAAKWIPWLSEYFDTKNRGLYNALAHKLKKVEADMPSEFAHIMIPDSQYGEIKAYHITVIERFHEIVREKISVDEEFMSNYRKDVSPKTKNA